MLIGLDGQGFGGKQGLIDEAEAFAAVVCLSSLMMYQGSIFAEILGVGEDGDAALIFALLGDEVAGDAGGIGAGAAIWEIGDGAAGGEDFHQQRLGGQAYRKGRRNRH